MSSLKSVCYIFFVCCYFHITTGQQNLEHAKSSEFLKVVKKKTFVDKTEFIESLYNGPRMMLFTAPHGYGKTTNLNMVKMFFSIVSADDPVILDVFRKLNIHNRTGFFKKNFAIRPVIFVDFKTKRKVDTKERALKVYRYAIHRSFKEHEYLLDSDRFVKDEKEDIRQWCGDNKFKSFDENKVIRGLKSLVTYLDRLYLRDVIVLVDNQDSVNNQAMISNMNNEEFDHVIELTAHILGRLLDEGVRTNKVVCTGLTYISPNKLSGYQEMQWFKFLGKHRFVPYFGFTENEVRALFANKKFKLKSDQVSRARYLYNGSYSYEGLKVYNPESILTFIDKKKAFVNIRINEHLQKLLNMFKLKMLIGPLQKLLASQTLKIRYHNYVDVSYIFEMRKILLRMPHFELSVDMILCYLIDLGLLSHDVDKMGLQTRSVVYLRVTNQEVHDTLFQLYTAAYIDKYQLREDTTTVEPEKDAWEIIQEKKKSKLWVIWDKIYSYLMRLYNRYALW